MPNLNRNFTSFELLTPGTSYIGWGPSEGSGNPQRSESIEVQGQLPFATGYELDGTDNQDPIIGVAVLNPNIDAVSEMKVTAQNYDAEFGKAVAGLVTAQTKSGSNSFHGTAFEYRRSDAQQARDPFANNAVNSLTGKYLSPTLHNQFGGSVGGPVIRNRVFFFGDYQGLREKSGSSVLTTVPTALAQSSCASGGNCNLSDYLNIGGQAFAPNSPKALPVRPRAPLSLYGGMPQFEVDVPANGQNEGNAEFLGTTANPNLQEESQYQFVNNWSHQLGNHNIKFGGDYRYAKAHLISVNSNALRSGTFQFFNSTTSGTVASGSSSMSSPGLGWATFLLGDTSLFWRTQTSDTSAATRQTRFFLYAQDQWRMTPKFTVDYGLRWELYTPESITTPGSGGLLDLDNGAILIGGVGSINKAMNVAENYKNFAPRIGVAYQVHPNTVVRAGFGTVYGQGWAGNTFGEVLTGSFPTQIQQTLGVSNNLAQKQLGVKYGAPYGWEQRVDYYPAQATGSYQSLQVVMNKRFAHGLQFSSNYVWSHALDHESYEFLINPAIGRGNSYYNRRNSFIFSGNYNLPFGHGGMFGNNVPGWENEIIGGWQVNAAWRLQSGLPFTTNYYNCSNDNDQCTGFLNKVAKFAPNQGSYNVQGNYVQYFTPSPYILSSPNDPAPTTPNYYGAFARPAVATWGNVGRDALWGPNFSNLDASVAKSFPLREGVTFQLMVQAFNAPNHVNLGGVNSCFDCQNSGAGQISSTVSNQEGTSMRNLQFAGRFNF